MGAKGRMLKLILLDQDRVFMDKIVTYASNTAKFKVLGAASDGETALKLLKSSTTDMILIDMEMPNKDGQYVLDSIAATPGHKPVFILFHTMAAQRKIPSGKTNYMIPKPSTMGQLARAINKIWEAKAKKMPYRKKISTDEISAELTPLLPRQAAKLHPKTFIQELLHKIGAPSNLCGNAYLQTAFVMIADKGDYKSGDLMNHIYPTVAKLHNTTPFQVERGIRYMANRTMEKGRDLIITNYLGIPTIPPGKRLTNSELLTALAYCYHRNNEAITEQA